MSDLSSKTTIYLNPKVKKFIQHKAVAEDTSVSDIINDQFSDMLEDLEDIQTIHERRGEPSVSFDVALKELGLTYEQLRS
ncbi:MAG TPA: hypothetical protein VGF75_01800 [Candidatus Saccharimonadales bacterium]|jgi:hypothetical protein